MRRQAERDDQTITIATSLAIFCGILSAGVLVGVLVNAMGGPSRTVTSALSSGTIILAGVVSIAYLVRHRRS